MPSFLASLPFVSDGNRSGAITKPAGAAIPELALPRGGRVPPRARAPTFGDAVAPGTLEPGLLPPWRGGGRLFSSLISVDGRMSRVSKYSFAPKGEYN